MLRERGVKEVTMNKAQRCWLHLRCISSKLAKGQDIKWHVQHIIREFGFGKYADPAPWPYSNMEKCNVVLKH
jgi:hypothetical protein